MSPTLSSGSERRHVQSGVAAVEFALVATVFFMILIGALEFGRLLWVWNAAGEATRLGARMAVVCDLNEPKIKVRMRERLPLLADGNISITYLPTACTALTCDSATVTLTGKYVPTVIPFVSIGPLLPAFTTTLSRESMSSAGNPTCT